MTTTRTRSRTPPIDRLRRFAMMNGTMEVRRPRVRNTAERFESQILPYFRRKSKQLGELLPELYLHGLATGDFEQAMRGRRLWRWCSVVASIDPTTEIDLAVGV